MKIVFAQGNPDKIYQKTRHNTGFMVLDAFGEARKAIWKDADKWKSRIAELTIGDEKIMLVKPLSFYNDTGLVARKLIDFYKLDPEHDLLIIHDDLSIPLGSIRVRHSGSDAGNNGVKSLNHHLGESYTRMRVGIWTDKRDMMDDVDFVLGKYDKGEQKTLTKKVIPHAIELIDSFIDGSLEASTKNLI